VIRALDHQARPPEHEADAAGGAASLFARG